MKKILTILIISLMFVSAKAQTDEEYRMEMGELTYFLSTGCCFFWE